MYNAGDRIEPSNFMLHRTVVTKIDAGVLAEKDAVGDGQAGRDMKLRVRMFSHDGLPQGFGYREIFLCRVFGGLLMIGGLFGEVG